MSASTASDPVMSMTPGYTPGWSLGVRECHPSAAAQFGLGATSTAYTIPATRAATKRTMAVAISR